MKAKGTFMGVCATISNKTNIDVFLIRIAFIILTLTTWGGLFIVYIILGLFASEA